HAALAGDEHVPVDHDRRHRTQVEVARVVLGPGGGGEAVQRVQVLVEGEHRVAVVVPGGRLAVADRVHQPSIVDDGATRGPDAALPRGGYRVGQRRPVTRGRE